MTLWETVLAVAPFAVCYGALAFLFARDRDRRTW